MIDIKWVRTNPEALNKALKNRGLEPIAEQLLALDAEKRDLQTKSQDLQNERNSIAKAIGDKKRQGLDAAQEQLRANALKEELPALENTLNEVSRALQEMIEVLPNIPLEDVPVGADETANVELKRFGTPKTFSFEPKAHFELGEALGMMDFETAALMSGARFVVLKGALAKLERALASFMLETHTQKFGYQEIAPPLLVRSPALYGAGLLPKFAQDAFHTEDDRWLIPTSEVPLSNLVRESILDQGSLPLRYVAHTPCFRAESGSAGRDTRGMIRLHQFNKVELVSITHPDQSREEHERMTGAAESILEALELPYRRILLCTGDMGVQSERTYDLEVWLPYENTYREISSCSTCGAYQARRMDARFKVEQAQDGKRGKTDYVHTLNGSGLAVGRTLVAVLENYQQEDGSITIPDVLKPYMGGLEKIQKTA